VPVEDGSGGPPSSTWLRALEVLVVGRRDLGVFRWRSSRGSSPLLHYARTGPPSGARPRGGSNDLTWGQAVMCCHPPPLHQRLPAAATASVAALQAAQAPEARELAAAAGVGAVAAVGAAVAGAPPPPELAPGAARSAVWVLHWAAVAVARGELSLAEPVPRALVHVLGCRRQRGWQGQGSWSLPWCRGRQPGDQHSRQGPGARSTAADSGQHWWPCPAPRQAGRHAWEGRQSPSPCVTTMEAPGCHAVAQTHPAAAPAVGPTPHPHALVPHAAHQHGGDDLVHWQPPSPLEVAPACHL